MSVIRKEAFWFTAGGTVFGSVVMLPITDWWNTYKDGFPDMFVTLGDFVLHPFPVPFVVVVVAAALVGWLTMREVRSRRLLNRQPPPVPKGSMREMRSKALAARATLETMPPRQVKAIELDDDETALLSALTQMAAVAKVSDLKAKIKLNDFRFTTALGSLASKMLVRNNSDYGGYTVSFTQDGREYAKAQGLDLV